MARTRSREDPAQGDLMDLLERMRSGDGSPQTPGALNVNARLRAALSEALRRCSLSRYQVAATMSEVMGVEVTKYQLDSWTAESKEDHRFPAAYLPAFCVATGTWDVLKMLAEVGGKRVYTDPNVDVAARIGALEAQVREREAELRERKRQLSEAHKVWARLKQDIGPGGEAT